MATLIRPASTSTFKRENVLFVPALADYRTGATVAECTAAANLDLTYFLFGNWGRPQQATNRPTRERRLGDGATYENIGITNYTGGDLRYVTNPNGVTGTDVRKAKEKLPEGTVGFFVVRIGLLPEADFAATPVQRPNIWPVEFGPQYEMPSSEAEEQEAVVMQTFAVTGPPALSVPIVA